MKPVLDLGMPATTFLRRYWQKKPRLIRQAIANFQCPISANDLAGMACQDDALARCVQGSGLRFRVQNGPFEPEFFQTLPKGCWTLLVQDVQRWDGGVAALLPLFDFLPRFRIEDIMVSYATEGGSVGAHTDHYDVFLLQAAGRRKWQIDDGKGVRNWVPKQALKLLADFQPCEEWVLEPGDLLYLPPGIGHHGVALDSDCMTFSIGLRAPSASELLLDLAEQTAELLPDNLRYSDPDLQPRAMPEALAIEDVKRVRALLRSVLKRSDSEWAEWLAGFFSRYRAPILSESAKGRALPALKAAQSWQCKPEFRAVLLPNVEGLYIGGRRVQMAQETALKLLRYGLTESDLRILSSSERLELERLHAEGAIHRAKQRTAKR